MPYLFLGEISCDINSSTTTNECFHEYTGISMSVHLCVCLCVCISVFVQNVGNFVAYSSAGIENIGTLVMYWSCPRHSFQPFTPYDSRIIALPTWNFYARLTISMKKLAGVLTPYQMTNHKTSPN